MTSNSPPLADVRVIDLAAVLAGPFGAAMLGDLGADVIKVEALGGDESRRLGPGEEDDSAMFIGANRNKRGLALDLGCETGQRVLKRLVEGADIVVDNMRPAARAKLGIDYDSLQAMNPRIISINVSAFGTSGPYAGRPGIDPLAQALGGIVEITGHRGGEPVKCGAPIVDGTTAHLVVIAALAALRQRDATGEGQLIEVNLLDAIVNLQAGLVSQALIADYVPPRVGCGSDMITPYDLYRCRDGKYLQVTGLNNKFFQNICRALDRQDLLEDERWSTMSGRRTEREELEAEIAAAIATWDSEPLLDRLIDCDVMAAPVKSMRETVQDPQVRHNRMVTRVEHARLGSIETGALPVRYAGSAERQDRAAPCLGQHTREVLLELGFDDAAIDAMLEQGVVSQGLQ
jgi:crotonobetainyl-CoA:carnitine CoA-transferase CaiB-like acyl-CoA transferase